MKENMLEVFFQGTFQHGGKIEEKSIIRMAKKRAVGNEYSYCTYEKEDEDYREGYVAVLFFEPFVERDLVLHIENNEFYEKMILFLSKLCTNKNTYINVENYLDIIKKDLNI